MCRSCVRVATFARFYKIFLQPIYSFFVYMGVDKFERRDRIMKSFNKKAVCTAMAIVMTAGMFAGCAKDEKNKKKNRSSEETTIITKRNDPELTPIKRQPVEVDVDPIINNPRIDSYTEFSLELLRNEYDGKNTMISPLSIMGALGMTMNGANGDTLAEMEEMFGLSLGDVNNIMYNINENYLGDEVTQANSIFLNSQKGYELQDDFRQSIVDYYNSDIQIGEFNDDMVDRINDFVGVNTNYRIKEIITELQPDDQMVLVNALSFDGEWETPFESDCTRDKDFTLENGETITVSMMYDSGTGMFIGGDNEMGYVKAYDGNYAFVALLPDEGLSMDEYLSTLTSEEVMGYIRGGGNQYGNYVFALPVFESNYEASLKDSLCTMGMESAFSGSADFTNMCTVDGKIPDLCISDVVHKSYISVNEEGTEAAAATAVVMVDACCEVEEPTVINYIILDRPFVYMIVNTATDMPVFAGVYSGVEA